METKQNCVTQTLIPLLFTLKTKIFSKIFLMMLRDANYDENDKRHLRIGKNKKVPGLFKD